MNKDWSDDKYKEFVMNLMNRAATYENYRRVRIAKAFGSYYGTNTEGAYDHLLSYYEKDKETEGSTPYKKLNFDSISPKVNILLGELNTKGMTIDIRATNMEAIKRKQVYENQIKFLSAMQAEYKNAAQMTGVEFGVNEAMPQGHESLKEHMDKYRDIFELLIQEWTNEEVYHSGYEEQRKNYLLDLLCSNEIHAKVDIVDGKTVVKRVNAMNCLPDLGTENDFFNDGQYFIEAYYVPIPDAIREFDIPKKQMDELIELYKEGNFGGWSGVNTAQGHIWAPFLSSNGDQNLDRVLVLKVEFKDIQEDKMKVTKDGYGNVHSHEFGPEGKQPKLTRKEQEDPANEILSKETEYTRRCCLLGGEYVIDKGFVENNRHYDSPARSSLSYVSVIHNYNNQTSVSLVDRISDIAEFKDYIMTLMQKEITTSIGGYIVVDTAFIDSNMYGTGKEASEKMLAYLKGYNVLFANTAENKGRHQGTPVKDVPAKTQGMIRDSIEIAAMLDREMEKITGINEARQGGGGDRALASTTEMKLSQSNMTTDTYFQSFYAWERRIWESVIEKTAILWARHPEHYEHIAARLGIELPEDIQIDLQSYRVKIIQVPITKAELNSMIEASMAQGNLAPDDALRIKLLTQENIKEGIALYLELADRRRKEESEAKQQESQALSQGNVANINAQNQANLSEIDRKGEWDMRKVQANTETSKHNNRILTEQKDRTVISKRSGDIEKSLIEKEKISAGDDNK